MLVLRLTNILNNRCKDVKERKRYVALVDSVKESGGEVKLFSSLHISGERKS